MTRKKRRDEILEDVPLEDLVPYEGNANIGDMDAVAASLEAFGYPKVSISVDEDMVILCGHTTRAAMMKLGWTHAPRVTRAIGLTEAQKRGFRIADNQTGRRAEWDPDLLLREIDDLRAMDFDVSATGFSPEEVEALRSDFNPVPKSGVRLDEKKKVKCPECGHEFSPN